jgi:hypothetical protein
MEVEKGQTRKIQGKVVKIHRCPATVRGTKATGKQRSAISGQLSAKT